MGDPRCDFYDWATRKSCRRPARWVTHQRSERTVRPERYYCDAHRPPRAHPITGPTAAPPPGSDR